MKNQTTYSRLRSNLKRFRHIFLFVSLFLWVGCIHTAPSHMRNDWLSDDERARELIVASLVAEEEEKHALSDNSKEILRPTSGDAIELALAYFDARSKQDASPLVELLAYKLDAGPSEILSCLIVRKVRDISIPLQSADPDLLARKCLATFKRFQNSDFGWETTIPTSTACITSEKIKTKIHQWLEIFRSGISDEAGCS